MTHATTTRAHDLPRVARDDRSDPRPVLATVLRGVLAGR